MHFPGIKTMEARCPGIVAYALPEILKECDILRHRLKPAAYLNPSFFQHVRNWKIFFKDIADGESLGFAQKLMVESWVRRLHPLPVHKAFPGIVGHMSQLMSPDHPQCHGCFFEFNFISDRENISAVFIIT